ncbi:conserved hypothetical protein [Histoplasma capsulatum H143]|uniref:Uncharacterized protein n=1 Tax=Ajellomyces capsulatus (strain H143) TaxID=544712 RepID=C6HKR5_AJECH|nr:conserved hypothetical protein [Histoplasma capsulatum H143]
MWVPQSFPTVPEQESGSEAEGDRTEYAMAEEDMTETSGSAHDTGKMPERDESDDGTPSPMPMHTPNANGMVTMSAADLRALIQQLVSARPIPNTTFIEDPKQLARDYQKEMQASLYTTFVTALDGANYQAWKIGMLSDAEVIGGADILDKNQHEPSEGPVRTTLGTIQPDNAAALWEKISDGDYLSYVPQYRYLSARILELAKNPGKDFFHDFFIIGLRDYQRTYVKSRLDTFYGTGQGPIINTEIYDLIKQLAHRTSKQRIQSNLPPPSGYGPFGASAPSNA